MAYGYLNLAWSFLNLVVCAGYNPYKSCKYCRGGVPPGLVMVPFSFGVAILSLHLRRNSVYLCKLPLLPRLVIQVFMGLTVQNYSTLIWIEADQFVLKKLSEFNLTEEEILLYWWYIMVSVGSLISMASLVISTCNKGHIFFKNGLHMKPWICYWNRLTERKVNFVHSVSIIPRTYK